MEKKVVDIFDEKYGRDFHKRTEKLREECKKLVEAIDNLSISPIPRYGEIHRLIDEMADVSVLIVHVASILNKNVVDLLEMAIDKVLKRVDNPDYNR